MTQPAASSEPEPVSAPRRSDKPDLKDYPVREYIAAMSAEMAAMARWDGDDGLAAALDAASALAARPA